MACKPSQFDLAQSTNPGDQGGRWTVAAGYLAMARPIPTLPNSRHWYL